MAKFGEAGSPVELSTVVYSCVSRLWTLAESKMSLEDLADLFSLVLRRISDFGDYQHWYPCYFVVSHLTRERRKQEEGLFPRTDNL